MISVIVTTHPPQFPFVHASLAAIDRQAKGLPVQKILVIDSGGDHIPAIAPDWQIIRGDFGNPGAARNAAIDQAESEWALFWDSDNKIPPGFLIAGMMQLKRVPPSVAILYPSISVSGKCRSDDSTGDPRRGCFTDTSSFWRLDAIRNVGGWETRLNRLEDYELGNRLIRAGWRAAPTGIGLELFEHPARRSNGQRFQDAIWACRPLGIISVFRGDVDLLAGWVAAVESQELPIHAGLTIVDNSGTVAFAKRLETAVRKISGRFERVSVLKGERVSGKGFRDIHNAIGFSYSKAIRATPEDVFLTWEDDVSPESPQAIKRLASRILPNNRVAVVAGVYESRDSRGAAVASVRRGRWGLAPMLSRIENKLYPCGMVGGGFTVWGRAYLEKFPILGVQRLEDGKFLGWDGFACERITAGGFEIFLDGGVHCKHVIQPATPVLKAKRPRKKAIRSKQNPRTDKFQPDLATMKKARRGKG